MCICKCVKSYCKGGSLGTVCNISFVRMCNWHRFNLKICAMYKQYVIRRFWAPHVHLAALSLCTWRLKPVWPLPLSGSDALSMQQVPESHHDQHICCQTLSSLHNHFEHWPRVRLVFFLSHTPPFTDNQSHHNFTLFHLWSVGTFSACK